MKLAAVKKSDFPSLRSPGNGTPIISFNGKNGSIAINSFSAKEFNLSPGDHVGFMKDMDEDPPEWYFRAIEEVSDDSFKLHKGSGRLQFTSKRLAITVIKDLLKKKNPNTPEEDLETGVLVRFQLATKQAMNGDQEIPNTYAIMGGTIFK